MANSSRNPLQDLTNVYTVRTLLNTKKSNTQDCRHQHKEIFTKIYSVCLDCGAFLVSSIASIRDIDSFKITTSIKECLKNMKKLQTINRHYSHKITNYKERATLVDWLCGIGEGLKQSAITIHKSVAYFDTIIATADKSAISKIKLVALASLMVASKYFELDKNIPRIKTLLDAANNEFTVSEMKATENMILHHLNWNLECTTPMDYLDFFLAQGVVFMDDKITQGGMMKVASKKASESVRKYCEFFADLCLQHYSFTEYSSLETASAIIASARKAIKFQKIWCDHLIALTGVEFRQIKPCFEAIYSVYYVMFPNAKATIEGNPKSTSRQQNIANISTHRDSSVSRISDGYKCYSSRVCYNSNSNANTSTKDVRNVSGLLHEKSGLKIKIEKPFPVKVNMFTTTYKAYINTSKYDKVNRQSKSINPLGGRKSVLRV
jgi:hypothetical protein